MYFSAFHGRLTNLYNDYCYDCRGEIHLTIDKDNPLFKKVQQEAEKAYKKLHKKGSYKAEDILDYSNLINATYDFFNEAISSGIKDNDIPEKMLQSLRSDAFLFGGLKTHAQLLEASSLLVKDGRLKSFNELVDDFNRLNIQYNEDYLEAEHLFAVQSSQMAAHWADVEQNKGRYNLQYRTANDDRVRDSHKALDGITLPANDPFWSSYYPPNGWRCRCTTVEVLKGKYSESNSKDSIKKGEKATSNIGKDGKNRLEIFRFNPGMKEVVFPPDNTYTKVKGAKIVSKIIQDNDDI